MLVSDPLHSLNASPLHADWSAAEGLKPANAALGKPKSTKPRAAIPAFLIVTIFWVGTLYWKLHSMPERMAHKSQKLQFEIVAVLGLISLFTHLHIFWVAGLLLAMIDLPDFGTPMRSMADSVERIADATPGTRPAAEPEDESAPAGHSGAKAPAKTEVHGHA